MTPIHDNVPLRILAAEFWVAVAESKRLEWFAISNRMYRRAPPERVQELLMEAKETAKILGLISDTSVPITADLVAKTLPGKYP